MKYARGIAAEIRLWMKAFSMRSMQALMRSVKRTGLSMPQAGILMHLSRGGHCGGHSGVHAIGERMGISNPAASMLVERLVRAGLVERSEQPGDRRARRIVLSAEGQALVTRVIRESQGWVDDLASLLSPREQATLRKALPVLIGTERRLAGEPAPAPKKARAKGGPR